MTSRVTFIGGAAWLALAAAGGGAGWIIPTPAAAQTSPSRPATSGPAPPEPLPTPPVPPRIAEGADYDRCLDQVETDPVGAAAFADAWEATGGGEGAAHCHALAMVEQGDAGEGAERLQALAAGSRAPAPARAAVFGQAARAWLLAGDAGRSYAAATLALALVPDDADASIARANAAANMERYQDAVDDLGRALDFAPRRADALVLRGAAWRHLGQLDLAQDDVDRALDAEPDNPEALLERGILRQRRGDPAGARADWQRAAELAPDTPAGELARQNLALLDAGPERR